MTVTYYSTDDDLLKIRPDILNFGVGSWADQHLDAFAIINRILIARWYKQKAAEFGVDYTLTEFDPDLVSTTQLKRLSCYKTLELAYETLMKSVPEEDGFERFMKLYQKKFAQELSDVLAIGISYDWDSSGGISSKETYVVQQRMLYRG